MNRVTLRIRCMHADSEALEAKDAGLAICSWNAALICPHVMRYMRNSGRQPPARSCVGCTFRCSQRPPRSATWKSAPSNILRLCRQTTAIRALHVACSQLSRLVRKSCSAQRGNKWQLDRCPLMAQRSTKVSREVRLVASPLTGYALSLNGP